MNISAVHENLVPVSVERAVLLLWGGLGLCSCLDNFSIHPLICFLLYCNYCFDSQHSVCVLCLSLKFNACRFLVVRKFEQLSFRRFF